MQSKSGIYCFFDQSTECINSAHSIDLIGFDPADYCRPSSLAVCSFHTQTHKAQWFYVLCIDDEDDRFFKAFYEANHNGYPMIILI